ncbi:MAG: hypothetical protein L3J56_10375 [Bacteroidales bacterium]|nr:hypothetical protein [Bacteroidales bacterium]
MKKLLTIVLAVALIAAIAYIYMLKSGFDFKTFLNKNNPKTAIKRVELRVKCPNLQNLLVTSTVEVTVKNMYKRKHNNVRVRVKAYDKNKKLIKNKIISFYDTLQPYDSLIRPILLPGKARTCKCAIIDSKPVKLRK